MPDPQPKHYVPLSATGGIWGDVNTPPSPTDWNWQGAKWTNKSGDFKNPDTADIGFQYTLTTDTLTVRVAWAESWLTMEETAIYGLGEDQDLSKAGLDALADSIAKGSPTVGEYAHKNTPDAKASDQDMTFRFTIGADFKRAGLIISAKLKRNDTAPGLTHYYTGTMGISVQAVPALHFLLNDIYWFSLMQVADATQPSGMSYLLHYNDTNPNSSYAVVRSDGTPANLMNADGASALGDDDIAFFGMLAPFSIFRQMATTQKQLGLEFLQSQFTDLQQGGALSGMVAFHGAAFALFVAAWKGIQGQLPLQNGGIARVTADLNTFLGKTTPPASVLDRLCALGRVVEAAGDTLMCLFPEASGEVLGKVAGKVVGKAAGAAASVVEITAQDLKLALQGSVEALQVEEKQLVSLLKDFEATPNLSPAVADAAKANVATLEQTLADVEAQAKALGPEIDKVNPQEAGLTFQQSGQIGSKSWNDKVKNAVAYLDSEAQAERMEKVAERHYRTKGATPATLTEAGFGTEEAFEQQVRFTDVNQQAVLSDIANDANLLDSEKKALTDYANKRFAKSTGYCSIDHIRIDHAHKRIQIVDRTGSWNFKHRTKTDFYKYLFQEAPQYSAYKDAQYEIEAIEYLWRE
jgi:hypothetical protein